MRPAIRCARLATSEGRIYFRATGSTTVKNFSQCIPRCNDKPFAYQSPEPPKSQQEQNGKRKSKDTAPGLRGKVFAIAIGGVAAFTYKAYRRRSGNSSDQDKSVDGFVKYTLIDKEEISSTSSIFTLKPVSGSGITSTDPSLKRAITSVQFKQPQLQIARSYTLLPPAPGQQPDELRFLIRQERNGEVSGYLHKLALGSDIEVRGPVADYALPSDVQKVVFLAGGTGIAPALQTADKLAGKADVHVLWANRRREECVGGESDTDLGRNTGSWSFSRLWELTGLSSPSTSTSAEVPEVQQSLLVSWLSLVKHQYLSARSGHGSLAVDYFVDEEGTFINPKGIAKLLKSSRSSLDGTSDKRLLLISGPEGFINYWAGPKEWANGKEVQGPLGGVLKTLDLKGWEVVKL